MHLAMIVGGLGAGGESSRKRKRYAALCMEVNAWPTIDEEPSWRKVPISFSEEDMALVKGPQCDPFVTALTTGAFKIARVFIDTGSGPDIMYYALFKRMQLKDGELHEPPHERLYRYVGSSLR